MDITFEMCANYGMKKANEFEAYDEKVQYPEIAISHANRLLIRIEIERYQ